MAEKEVSEEKDANMALLDRLGDIEVFRSESQGTVEKIMSDLAKAPVPKQLAVGGVAGWTAGYLTMKAGKMAATAIGGSLLLLQIAHHKGYIKVDWNKMTTDSASMADKIKKKLHMKSKSGFEKFQEWSAKNVYLAGGFTGGFFLGIASS
eukprot:TRINITY_DN5006_c0_g1_i1.p1 TRINITY_DN5006_c0_g1~~TRINITY_DN5006_c0_g1_i1.p1  ORF type:complete len:150 (-),score=56.07 TRINITY_DN5006_c0_g1_i1:164-613(-)